MREALQKTRTPNIGTTGLQPRNVVALGGPFGNSMSLQARSNVFQQRLIGRSTRHTYQYAMKSGTVTRKWIAATCLWTRPNAGKNLKRVEIEVQRHGSS